MCVYVKVASGRQCRWENSLRGTFLAGEGNGGGGDGQSFLVPCGKAVTHRFSAQDRRAGSAEECQSPGLSRHA